MKSVLFIVALLVATLPVFAQECVVGQCAKSPSDRVLSAVVSVAELPARVVEHVVCDVQPVRSVVSGAACAVKSLAQSKAEKQAARGSCYHVGGGFGNGRYEGVGYSSVSADDAIRRCCYWGRLSPVDIGVARGRSGWYATVIYR